MKRVFIIHRWSGGPNDDWRPWLKAELEKQGYEVYVPEMPDTEEPDIKKWVSTISKIVGTPDAQTFFVGHSIGNQAILRYLESINVKVGGVVFVAGWFNLKNLEGPDVERVAKPWIETPIDLKHVKSVLPQSTLIISDNDPFEYFEENKKKFSELGSKIIVLPGAGHITEESGFTKLPEVLSELEAVLL